MSIDFDKSWGNADRICFEKAREYLGGTENKDCFRGFLPAGAPNVWMFSSGGGAETQIGRMYGDNPCFGTIRLRARFAAQYPQPEREKALIFGNTIIRMLSETTNMKNTGNVQWLRLTDMPQEPALFEAENGWQFWQCIVDCELIYATTTTFS